MALNVTLVFTQHEENGFCSSSALQKIMEEVNPKVIFEELSHSNYHKIYIEKTLITLESSAIMKHLKNHDVKHIPIDTYDLPQGYYVNIDYMYDKLLHNAGVHSYRFRSLLDQKESVINQYGFLYLNNDYNDKLFENIDMLKERILDTLNDKKLFRIAHLEKEVVEKREDVIIDNVFNYSKENGCSNGLMFIGSGHRKSIKRFYW
jgi:hypothetical protein